jgi:hypothetical protein
MSYDIRESKMRFSRIEVVLKSVDIGLRTERHPRLSP